MLVNQREQIFRCGLSEPQSLDLRLETMDRVASLMYTYPTHIVQILYAFTSLQVILERSRLPSPAKICCLICTSEKKNYKGKHELLGIIEHFHVTFCSPFTAQTVWSDSYFNALTKKEKKQQERKKGKEMDDDKLHRNKSWNGQAELCLCCSGCGQSIRLDLLSKEILSEGIPKGVTL